MTRIERPEPGRAVLDPEFGTTIRRISDAHAESPRSGKYGIRTLYTGTPAWNLDQTLLLTYSPGAGYFLYRGGTFRHGEGPLEGEPDYSFLGQLDLHGIDYPTDFERLYWSAEADDPAAARTLYFPNQRHKLMKLVLSERGRGRLEEVRDFREQCAGFGYGHQLITDSHHWASFDGQTWGFKCGPNSGAHVFGYDLATDTVLWQKTHRGGGRWSLAGTPVPTPSGQHFIVNTDEGLAIWDRRGEPVGKIPLKLEHATMTLSGEGDLYVTTVFDEPAALSGTIVACSIPEGACRLVAGRKNGLPYPPSGTHHSGIAYLNPGWIATSVVGFEPLDGRKILNQELLLTDLRKPEAPRVARIAHHRSARAQNPSIDNHYWQEPHPVISPDGCRIAFNSDWSAGRPEREMFNRVDVFVVELPCFRAESATPPGR